MTDYNINPWLRQLLYLICTLPLLGCAAVAVADVVVVAAVLFCVFINLKLLPKDDEDAGQSVQTDHVRVVRYEFTRNRLILYRYCNCMWAAVFYQIVRLSAHITHQN